jgi:ssRNA-specific RNase YbeY (16S rRNA maturation enzyme)
LNFLQGLNAPTDILSFGLLSPEQQPEPEPEPEPERVANQHIDLAEIDLGDLVLGVEYLQRWCATNAEALPSAVLPRPAEGGRGGDIVWQQRVPVIIAHGLAHLLGHTHETDADHAEMQTCEQALLRQALTAAHAQAPPTRVHDNATCTAAANDDVSGANDDVSGANDDVSGADEDTAARNSRGSGTGRGGRVSSLAGSSVLCRAGCAERAVAVGVCCPVCLAALQRKPQTVSTETAAAAGAAAAAAVSSLGLQNILAQGCEM